MRSKPGLSPCSNLSAPVWTRGNAAIAVKNAWACALSLLLMMPGIVLAKGCPAAAADGLDSNRSIESLKRKLEDPHGNVMVIAHRACWHGSAENSLAAIQQCIDAGIDMVEIDVRRSQDGQLLLMHDISLDRTSTGQGDVADWSWSRLQNLWLRSGQGGAGSVVTGQRIPLLKDALCQAQGRILLNLDAKEDVFADAMKLAAELGVADHVVFKARLGTGGVFPQGSSTDTGFYFMPIIDQKSVPSADAEAYIKAAAGANGPIAYEMVYQTEAYLNALLPALSESGGRLWVNTLEPRHAAGWVDENAIREPDAVWGALIAKGVGMIQTDYPFELKAYLDRKRMPPTPSVEEPRTAMHHHDLEMLAR